MRTLALLASICLALIFFPGTTSAEVGTSGDPSVDDPNYVGDPPPCGSADVATLSAVDCVQSSDPVPSRDDEATGTTATTADPSASSSPVADPGLPANCRIHLEAVFYTESQWVRLGQELAADPSPCADYYILIPAVAPGKITFRLTLGAASIHALGPRFHAVADINVQGWSKWIADDPTHTRTWTDAGIEARRRMADPCRGITPTRPPCPGLGYDIASGDTWAVNELSSAVRQHTAAGLLARKNMRDFISALHDGDGTVPVTKGIVFVIGLGQNLVDPTAYKANLESWFEDAPFWAEMARDVRWWGQEVYPNSRTWGVVGAPRAERAEYFNEYLYHPLTLAEAGPSDVATARAFLESSYTALTSAAWRWPSAFGNTDISQVQMNNFVSEEIFSVRHYVGSHPQTVPQGFFATAWAPHNLDGLPETEFADQTRAILERLASALHHSYEQGGSSQEGACGPPGEHVWCDENVDGAAFNDAWKVFATW
jgi:hypothetical protein